MSRSFLVKVSVVSLVFSTSVAMAGMVSTMGNVNAVMEDRGYRLVPVSERYVPGDESPARVYEIIRPRGERITIGRLNTSCSCVRLEADKAVFERGERAFVILRNVRATPPNGQNYAFYVQVTSPIRTTLRADLFLQSDRFRQARQQPLPLAMQPTPYQGQYQQPYPAQQPSPQYQSQSQYLQQYQQTPAPLSASAWAQPHQSAYQPGDQYW